MDPQEFLRMRGIGVGKKLVGDAQSGDVRAGKTFSNAQGNDKQGTMPVRSLVAQTITPGVNNIIKQAGIYDGDMTIEGDPDLLAQNIITGKNIFGVAGSLQPGKRWATGGFTGTTDNTVQSIRGLAFRPKTVIVTDIQGQHVSHNYFSVYSEEFERALNASAGTGSPVSGQAVMYSNGFDILVDYYASVSQTRWIAYE